jgi:hypothetical protein
MLSLRLFIPQNIMIVEIKEYASNETLILVSEIVSVKMEENHDRDGGTSLAKTQYQFIVKLKDRNDLKFWFNGEKERCLVEYQKVKNAFLELYRKDTVEQEIKKYLRNMSQAE